MHKISFLIFALAITHTLTQSCANPLLTEFGITAAANPLGTPAATTGLNYCKSFDSGTKSCCTTAEINAQFATKYTTLFDGLKEEAGKKDNAIIDARAAIAKAQTNLTALSDAFDAAETQLDAYIAAPPGTWQGTEISDLKTFVEDYLTEAGTFFSTYADLRTGFTTYQQARATCFTELVKDQVATWCLACDSTWETQGVEAGTPPTIDFTTAFKTQLKEACYDYVVASAQQGTILRLGYYVDEIDAMTAALKKITAKTEAGLDDLETAVTAPGSIDYPAASKPVTCAAEATCEYIVDDFFPNGELDSDEAILAGTAVTERRRILQQGRSLATTGTWAAADGEAKITIAFPENPDSTVVNVNDLSALRVGVFSCIVAFFVALLI